MTEPPRTPDDLRMQAEVRDDPPTHQPGDPHHYRIECEVCGQRGVIRLSVDPQYVEEPS